ncbi:MAG: 3-oxoacyl-[acyl-carrier-protein] reductase [Bacillota bacterium]
MGLTERVALVTGASRGIGRAVAEALARAGAHVAVNYRSDATGAAEVAATVESLGRRSLVVQADVADPAAVQAMVDGTVEALGGIDILVNNAGVIRDGLLVRMRPEDWDRVIAIDLTGAYLCARAAARHMLRKRFGRIINVSSVVAVTGNPGQANYCAAKAGLLGLTKALALELASRQVTVNAVAPGFIDTEMTAALGLAGQVAARVPLGRVGTPEDVAQAIVFLASPGAEYITGQTLLVDGGLSLGL